MILNEDYGTTFELIPIIEADLERPTSVSAVSVSHISSQANKSQVKHLLEDIGAM